MGVSFAVTRAHREYQHGRYGIPWKETRDVTVNLPGQVQTSKVARKERLSRYNSVQFYQQEIFKTNKVLFLHSGTGILLWVVIKSDN